MLTIFDFFIKKYHQIEIKFLSCAAKDSRIDSTNGSNRSKYYRNWEGYWKL